MRFNIKKRLNKELDAIVPSALKIDGVTDAEFSLATDGASVKVNGARNLKITLTCVLLAIVLFLTCWFAIPLFAKNPLGKRVIVLEINPCVKVASDENGKVVSVVSGNSDGDVVLYDLRNNKLVGKTEEEVILILIDKAVELDFISDNREVNKINLSVLTENGSDALAKKLNSSVLNYLFDSGIYGVVENKTLSVKEYSDKFSQSFETAKDVFEHITTAPEYVYQNELLDGLTEDDFLLEYKNFLQEITLSYCNIIDLTELANIIGQLTSLDNVQIVAKYILCEIKDTNIKDKLENLFNGLTFTGVTEENFSDMKQYILNARVEVNKQNASVYYKAEKPKITQQDYENFLNGLKK